MLSHAFSTSYSSVIDAGAKEQPDEQHLLLLTKGREAAASPPGPHGTYETHRRCLVAHPAVSLDDQHRLAWSTVVVSLPDDAQRPTA